jgi:betaine-aldehyde dehydrogenase
VTKSTNAASTVSTTTNNFVGGKWVATLDGKTDAVIAPATGEVIANVASSGAKDVDKAVKAAAKAFETWGKSSPAERAVCLNKFADAIEADRDNLIAIESRNVGKPLGIVPPEVDFMIDNLRFFAAGARAMTVAAPGEYLGGYTSILRREPLELPDDDGRLESRASTRRWQRRGAEAVGTHAAHCAAPR